MSTICEFLDLNGKPTSKVTQIAKVTIDGFVSLTQYVDITSKLEKAILRHPGKIRILEDIKCFYGLEPTAVIPMNIFCAKNGKHFERIAAIGTDALLLTTISALAPLAYFRVRIFLDSDNGRKEANDFVYDGVPPPPPGQA